ncbi:MAG: deoxyhypusine synthase family protein, partial [Candidatus Bilamarchaeaceae archaeon]
MKKADYLKTKIEHIDITSFDATPVIEQYSKTAFQARNLARAAKIYDRMLADNDCTVILCIAGSLVSAGLKKVICDMIEYNMADVVVATGANVVDQDFFEGLGFHHYQGTPRVDDDDLFRKHIDRIYDTYID